jgi:hypothetical protein
MCWCLAPPCHLFSFRSIISHRPSTIPSLQRSELGDICDKPYHSRNKTTTVLVHTMTDHATKTIAARGDDLLPVFTPAPNCLQDLYVFSDECQTATSETCTYFHVGPRWRPASCFPDPEIHTTACPASYTPIREIPDDPFVKGTYRTLTCCPE